MLPPALVHARHGRHHSSRVCCSVGYSGGRRVSVPCGGGKGMEASRRGKGAMRKADGEMPRSSVWWKTEVPRGIQGSWGFGEAPGGREDL